jgi:hypothetical protein
MLSLPVYTWLRAVLFFALLAAWVVVVSKWPKGSRVTKSENAKNIWGFEMKEFLKRYRLQTLFFTVCGIILIYTIIGIILENIAGFGPVAIRVLSLD